MTSTAFAPSLSLPPMDDTMEMSSPARNNDGDIDIDFDDYAGGVQLTDDEHMLEDGEPARPGTATDDMMADDDHFNVTSAPVIEAEMQDDEPYVHQDGDEELIDYDDAELQDQVPDQPIPDATPADVAPQVDGLSFQSNIEAAPELGPAKVSEEIVQRMEAPTVELSNPSADTEVQAAVEEHAVEQPVATGATGEPSLDSTTDQQQAYDEANSAEPQIDAPLEWDETALQSALEDDVENDDEPAQKPPPQLQGTIDTSTTSFAVEGPPTPTDTGLHPMIIQFGDYEWPLFKSRAQSDGLLKDDNLVNVSLAELLSSCRQRLNKCLADAVSIDQNLTINFDRIGLMLNESSADASAVSLNDVLEVYISLYQNDGVEDIPQLSMTLTTQLKFTSHLNLLKQAASSGTGMSTYSRVHNTGNVDREDYDEAQHENEPEAGEPEYEEETHNEQLQSAEDSNAQHSAEEAEQHHDESQEHHEEYQREQDDQEYQFDQYEEGNYEDYDESTVQDPNAEQPDQANDVAEPTADQTVPAEVAGEEQHAVAPESTATSATLRADATNDVAGKYYPEDCIDFDEDDLTPDLSELHEDDGEDEFSAFLNAYDDQEAQHTESGTDAPHETTNTASAKPEDAEAGEDAAYALGAEDFVNEDFTEYQQDEGTAQADGAETGDHQADHEITQADHVDYDQQDDLQPGEEDQFHTAFDLLDGGALEDDQHDQPVDDEHAALPDEDDIGFDDEEEEPALPAETSVSPSRPLRGKRSFDEHADADELDFDEHESKKHRSD